MSKLDELIEEYCPQGVVFKPLGEVVKFINGRAYKQPELLNDGKYKVLRVGNFHTNDKWYYSDLELDKDKYCDDGDLLYTWAATLGPQIWHGDKVIFHYHIWKLMFDENVLDKRFLYHFFQMDIDTISKSLTQSTVPHVSMESMNKRTVPVPPLPVQREIVRILDNFTELIAELIAELTARKKQYEYYHRKLLSLSNDVPRMKLGDICDLSSGGDVPKEHWSKEKTDVFMIPIYSNGIENDGLYGYTDIPRITQPSVTIAGRGAGVGNAIIRKQPYFPIIRLVSAVPKEMIDVDYLYHCIKLIEFKIPQGGIPQLTVPMVSSYEIPVPELAVQKRIATKLNLFEMIIKNIHTGIPAEIEARTKQYEYYRDKLLTFKELS